LHAVSNGPFVPLCRDQAGHVTREVVATVLLWRTGQETARGCAGIGVPAGSALSATCTRRIWHALWIQTPPCGSAGQAQAAWPGREPILQAAYEQAIRNQPAIGRSLPSSFGARVRPSETRVACGRGASQGQGPGDARQATTPSESPAEAAVMRPEPPVFKRESGSDELRQKTINRTRVFGLAIAQLARIVLDFPSIKRYACVANIRPAKTCFFPKMRYA
jgi:hypothetical protein